MRLERKHQAKRKHQTKQTNRRKPGRATPYRPTIEHLETRLVPATLPALITADQSFTDDVTVSSNVQVDGSRTVDLTGYDLVLDAGVKVTGNSAGGRDSLTIKADEVTLRGQIGGGGMQNITIEASKITILDNALLT